MNDAFFFIPGTFRLTNGMLDDLHAAGFARGRGVRQPRDRYNDHVREIRNAAALHARAVGLKRLVGIWDLAVLVVGHGRHDPDAWMLAGKAILDGLVQAQIIGSDRKQIRLTSGTVLKYGGELEICKALRLQPGRPGCIVRLMPAEATPREF
jgi:hypothetical protein